jgi:hypothetical protein
VPHPPVQEPLSFPASGRREVRAACDPSRPLLPEHQAQLHEDLSIAQGGDRIRQIENRIRDAWADSYVCELVTGHAGCGKSTELLRLARELRKPRDGRAYHVVHVDAHDYLNRFEVGLPQLVVSLMAALAEEPGVDLRTTRSGPKLWDQVRALLTAAGREIGSELVTEVPVLKSLLRVDLKFVRDFRRQSSDHIPQILSLIRELVREVRAQLPADQGEIVFVVDNLEKVPDGETETPISLHDTLFLRELPLLDVPAHLVLTYPISLNYSSVALRQVFRNARQTTIPMVGIRQKPGPQVRGDDVQGIAALRRLLARRVRIDQVFADEGAILGVIRESGGCVRDLLRLVGEMPTVGAMPFSSATVEAVIADGVNDYERILQGKPYLPLLPTLERTGAFPADTSQAWIQSALQDLVALEYDGGTWYDVHSLAKRTRAFRTATR